MYSVPHMAPPAVGCPFHADVFGAFQTEPFWWSEPYSTADISAVAAAEPLGLPVKINLDRTGSVFYDYDVNVGALGASPREVSVTAKKPTRRGKKNKDKAIARRSIAGDDRISLDDCSQKEFIAPIPLSNVATNDVHLAAPTFGALTDPMLVNMQDVGDVAEGTEVISTCAAEQCGGITNCANADEYAQATAESPESAAAAWPKDGTTIMLRNIPNRYTAEELLAEMLAAGFQGTFDFFYLPIDFSTKRNRGYGFINFQSEDSARLFLQKFHAQRLTRYATRKILEVFPAATQGFDANVAKFVRKDAQRIQNPWFRPMIFSVDGDQSAADKSGAIATAAADGAAAAAALANSAVV
eukprot:TRINITY_DN42878_c0_g1_i1.p1 TRINITY_DN42878_c0_g1~~TRINITY_DN42878_c0_g1_i1.p1  ORF type:complete len:355 (+),score=67.47 TRINITY_DN42878_c0_g1_i1:135-1199(+)